MNQWGSLPDGICGPTLRCIERMAVSARFLEMPNWPNAAAGEMVSELMAKHFSKLVTLMAAPSSIMPRMASTSAALVLR